MEFRKHLVQQTSSFLVHLYDVPSDFQSGFRIILLIILSGIGFLIVPLTAQRIQIDNRLHFLKDSPLSATLVSNKTLFMLSIQ